MSEPPLPPSSDLTSSPSHDLIVEESATQLCISQGRASRLGDALRRFMLGTSVGFGVMMIVFAPDYLARFRGESGEINALYFTSLLAVSLLLGAALAFSRWVRQERWVLDREQRELRVERRMLFGSDRQEAIDLEHVAGFARSGRRLEARLKDGPPLSLVSAQRAREIDLALQQLDAFCKRHALGLEVRQSATLT